MNKIKAIKAFLHGAIEFRSDCTANYDDEGLQWEYDLGREFAHRVTLRRFDY